MSGTKIKICGLFRPCDAEYVNIAKPDFAGFVFYEKSRRKVGRQEAYALRKAVSPAIKTVGVFVDYPAKEISELYRDGIISIVQLHGNEDDEYIKELKKLVPDTSIWKAYKIASPDDIDVAMKSMVDIPLLDSGYGTGKQFDWSLIGGFSRPFILAGGLTPENIPEAISQFNPYAVDISSGVESGGDKDRQKMINAVLAVRNNI